MSQSTRSVENIDVLERVRHRIDVMESMAQTAAEVHRQSPDWPPFRMAINLIQEAKALKSQASAGVHRYWLSAKAIEWIARRAVKDNEKTATYEHLMGSVLTINEANVEDLEFLRADVEAE